MTSNKVLSKIFDEIADALEFQGENTFKIAAYRKASRVLNDLSEDVSDLYREKGVDGLKRVPGIGERIAKKIEEYILTGKMRKYEEVMSQVPRELLGLLNVQGLGPKTLRLAHDKLGVSKMDDLIRVIEDGSLAALPGMGEKKIENIKKGLELFQKMRERIPLGLAYPLVNNIVERLRELKGVDQVSPAGSFRRMKETVGDLDILATGERGRDIIDFFVRLPGVTRVLAHGETKGSVIFEDKYQVDLRVVPRESYGAALQYFTGSKAHNIKLRTIAKSLGLKVSEYGVFRGEKKVAGLTEEEVYEALGLKWIPPEMREDLGEVELALENGIPPLILLQEIRGDSHVHSRYSDGTATLEEIAQRAKEMGYEYVVVADHSGSAKYAKGLDIERLRKKMAEIREVNKRFSGITLLMGAEVDILQDGSLDYPDEILKELDVVIGAIHIWSKKDDMTPRLLKAMENPYLNIVTHPTGRLISSREGYRIDVDLLIKKAAMTHTALEINAYYDRLDLSDVNARKARELGVKMAIGTDAHNLGQLWMMVLGVGAARRAWCKKEDILNSLPLKDFIRYLRTSERGVRKG